MFSYTSVNNFTLNEAEKGDNWSILNLHHNLLHYGPDIFSTKNHPLFYTILVIIGALYLFKQFRKEGCYLLIWFATLAAVYFTSFIQIFQADGQTRFMLYFYPITGICASCGFLAIHDFAMSKLKPLYARGLSLILLLIFLISFVPYIKYYINAHRDTYKLLITDVIEKAEKTFLWAA